MTIYIYKIYMK